MTCDIERQNSAIFAEGLIKPGDENPLESNCLVNFFLMDFDTARFGYGPYDREFSHLLRENKISRTEWQELYEKVSSEIAAGTFRREEIRRVLADLKLNWDGKLLAPIEA